MSTCLYRTADHDFDQHLDRAVRLASAGPVQVPDTAKELAHMLLYEELARSRIRDLHEDVRYRREARNARAARRWQWVASWATARSRRHSR